MVFYFPDIDPVVIRIGPLAIHWYALAYLAGLLLGRLYIQLNLRNPALPRRAGLPETALLEDLLSAIATGVIVGGRFGYVLFYKPTYYMAHPLKIFYLWEGGMSFHGGLLGTALALWLFARKHKLSALAVGDAVAPAVPIGLFFGRIANFINAELWGRVSDVPWAIRFPLHGLPGAYGEARHPSQLYEAFAEGVLLYWLLRVALRRGAWLHPGAAVGIFLCGYAVARIGCEFFREPDAFLGFVLQLGDVGLTQGMVLSLPLAAVGGALLWQLRRGLP